MYNITAFSHDLKKPLPLLDVCCSSLSKKTAKVVIHDVDVRFVNAVAEICLNISTHSREKFCLKDVKQESKNTDCQDVDRQKTISRYKLGWNPTYYYV